MNFVDLEQPSDSEYSEDELFIAMVQQVNSIQEENDEWTETLIINNTEIKFQLDTGAKCNVMSKSTFETTNLDLAFSKSDAPLRSYSGHIIKTLGSVILPCKYRKKMYQIKFHVINSEVQPVISAETCKEMGLVKRIHTVSSVLPGDIQKVYGDLFQGLGCLPGTYTINLDDSVQPVVHAPRKIPISLKDQVKKELNRMEEIGVVVKQKDPTRWVNSMVVVRKPNGKIRLCIDPRDLNKAVQREHFPLKTVEEVVSQMPGAKVFSRLDAVSGFWHVRLDEPSSRLCTFNTPFGRYRFLRLPFGIKSAPEVFQKFISDMVKDIEGAEAIMDDIIVWGRDLQEHDRRLRKVLDKVREYNLKLGLGKCEFRKSEITYVGHRLTSEGLKPDPEKVRAVEAMERPTCVKELQTFLGFIQYMGKFMPNISTVTAPLRILLEKNTPWYWDEDQENSFQQLKKMATNTPILQYYDPNKPLTLSVDASSKGLGAVLIQDEKPVAYGSRALTETQQRYPQIEKEALAILFGCRKFHEYVCAREVEVETDHKPLESIFKKPLLQAPPRLQSQLLTLQRYDLKVTYKPGKTMLLADQLSRSYLPETKEVLVPSLEVNDIHLISHLPIAPAMYTRFQSETNSDEELQRLQDIVLEGWPENRSDLAPELHKYWNFRDEISCIDGLLYKSHKLIVPNSLKNEMLDLIHQSHLGIVKCISRAKEVLFWIGMGQDIERKVRSCGICAEYQNQNAKEPMLTPEIPDRPWSKLGIDLFELKSNNYLLVVDYLSKWPEIVKLDNLSSRNTIDHLKGLFSRYGYPDVVVSDNGPQFVSQEFKRFEKDYGFSHVTSSPRFPQSNGQAERAIQTVKKLIKKSKNTQSAHEALLAYRNTPLDIGLSPSQLFLGRRVKTSLPTSAPLLSPLATKDMKDIQERLKGRQMKYKADYDHRCGRELRPLHEGESVSIRTGDKWYQGEVVGKFKSPRSYIVQTPEGQRYRRNRRHLRPTQVKKSFVSAQPEFPENMDNGMTKNMPKSGDNLAENGNGNGKSNSTVPPSAKSPSAKSPVKTRSGRIIRPPTRYDE